MVPNDSGFALLFLPKPLPPTTGPGLSHVPSSHTQLPHVTSMQGKALQDCEPLPPQNRLLLLHHTSSYQRNLKLHLISFHIPLMTQIVFSVN